MKRLVVVESPTKAKTIRAYLPATEFRIESSRGHVRDLPSNASEIPERVREQKWARLGVDVERDFEPLYVVPADKRATVKQLKDALAEADELIIATDEDREGESIGWHLVEVLRPRVPVKRMVFHEITRDAILKALEDTRVIDQNLVDAQEARRILDRLVGYSVSPVLWRKVKPRLSAGRVQSVAVRLIVQRELERLAFVSASYWDLRADLAKKESAFSATLTHVGGQRVATGRDFDPDTGKLNNAEKLLLLGEKEARDLAKRLPTEPWRVAEVEEKQQKRSPAAPFITSTLQQEASRKLGLSARQTMRVAQALYEQGYITYMRTDSTTLSQEAVDACRRTILQRYGDDFLTPKPRTYGGKVRNAQEAHEAIRPAGKEMRTADELGLAGADRRLYDLIWKRTVASQMADARLRMVTATIEAGEGDGAATFRASGRTVEFPGFFRAYVEGTDDPDAALEDRDQPLPPLKKGDSVDCRNVEPLGHETKPPARFTEASLVKVLEKEGIGRPSTYASIMDTIMDRGYVSKQGLTLVPTFTAMAVNQLMERQFDNLVDVGFTAEMEEALDRIAAGDLSALPYLKKFYRGDDGLEGRVSEGIEGIDPREVSTIKAPQWGDFVVRVGRYGPYVEGEVDGERVTASVPEDIAPADLTREGIEEFLASGNTDDRVLGIHPTAEQPVLLRKGPYGFYVQLGDDEQEGKPKRTSLPKNVEPGAVSLDLATRLLDLPRTVGVHPDTGVPIKASLGRFGPYVQHGSTFASLAAEDDVLDVGLDRALELLYKKERKNQSLRLIGLHPQTEQPVEVFEGRYGPYVKHAKTNASLHKEQDPMTISLEDALTLLAAKEASGKSGGRKSGGRTAKSDGAAKKPRASASKSTKSTGAKTSKPAGGAKKSPGTKGTGRAPKGGRGAK